MRQAQECHIPSNTALCHQLCRCNVQLCIQKLLAPAMCPLSPLLPILLGIASCASNLSPSGCLTLEQHLLGQGLALSNPFAFRSRCEGRLCTAEQPLLWHK